MPQARLRSSTNDFNNAKVKYLIQRQFLNKRKFSFYSWVKRELKHERKGPFMLSDKGEPLAQPLPLIKLKFPILNLIKQN